MLWRLLFEYMLGGRRSLCLPLIRALADMSAEPWTGKTSRGPMQGGDYHADQQERAHTRANHESFPIFFRDGTVVPSSSFDDSDMNHVPVLVFYSTDEFSILADADAWFRQRRKAQTPENPDATLEQDKAFSIKYGSLIWGISIPISWRKACTPIWARPSISEGSITVMRPRISARNLPAGTARCTACTCRS